MRGLKTKVTVSLLVGLVLMVIYWLLGHSFIEISIDNPTGSPISYELVGRDGRNKIKFTDNNSKVRKLVRQDSYDVLVEQAETSYFTVASTKGFLSKTTIDAKLVAENERRFVGNNPSPCMNYIQQVLISFHCNSSYKNTQIHIPANKSLPTFSRKNESVIDGDIEGIVETGEGLVALIKADGASEDQGAPHTAYLMTYALELRDGIEMPNLNADRSYTAIASEAGFIVYDNSFDQILHYKDRAAQPTAISVDKAKSSSLSPYMLSVGNNNSVVVSYSSTDSEADLDDPTLKIKSEVVVASKGSVKRFNLNYRPSSSIICGLERLCVLGNKKLEIYDINGSKQKLMYSVNGIDAIENTSNGLVLVRGSNVVRLDIEKREGSISYSLGNYKYCGIRTDNTRYTLCLINSRSKKIALEISLVTNNMDSIDKKIATLLETPEIDDISIYGNHVFISPVLGELNYDETSSGYRVDESTKNHTNSVINAQIDKVGLDKNRYLVKNSFE